MKRKFNENENEKYNKEFLQNVNFGGSVDEKSGAQYVSTSARGLDT